MSFNDNLIKDYDSVKEYFDSFDKNMKIRILFGIVNKEEYYDIFINMLNNHIVDEYINEIYKNYTLLEHAYEHKNYLVFDSLLNYPKIDLYIKDGYGENILYKLIRCGEYKLFMLCIEKMDETKIDTNFKNIYGKTLLFVAAAQRNPDFLKVLLALPCSHDLYIEDDDSYIPLQIALSKGNIENFKIIYELWDNTCDINIYSPLNHAIHGGVDMVKFSLGLNNIDFNKRDENGETAFYEACHNENTDIMKLFLKDDRIDINLSDHDDITPFCVVCYNSNISNEQIKMMLDYSKIRYIDLNKPDKNGVTPFHFVVLHCDVKGTKLLLEFDGDIDYNSRDINGISPFYSACWNDKIYDALHDDSNDDYYYSRILELKQNHIEIVKLLLNDDRIDKSDIDKAYQIIKDNEVGYMIEILADYLNHKNL